MGNTYVIILGIVGVVFVVIFFLNYFSRDKKEMRKNSKNPYKFSGSEEEMKKIFIIQELKEKEKKVLLITNGNDDKHWYSLNGISYDYLFLSYSYKLKIDSEGNLTLVQLPKLF
jgi:hypothetical protein